MSTAVDLSAASDILAASLSDTPAKAPDAPTPEPATPAVATEASPAPVEPSTPEPAAPVEPLIDDVAPGLLDDAPKAPEDKAAEPAKEPEKPVEEPKAPEAVKEAEPEKPYEIAFPDGVKAEDFDPEQFGKFKSLMEGSKFPPEKAKELLSLYQEDIKKVAEQVAGTTESGWKDKSVQAFTQMGKQWADEVKNDPKLGGDNIQRTKDRAIDVIEKSDLSPSEKKELYTRLRQTHMGSALPLIRLLNSVWNKTMTEGEVVPNDGRQSSTINRDLGDVLFGK